MLHLHFQVQQLPILVLPLQTTRSYRRAGVSHVAIATQEDSLLICGTPVGSENANLKGELARWPLAVHVLLSVNPFDSPGILTSVSSM